MLIVTKVFLKIIFLNKVKMDLLKGFVLVSFLNGFVIEIGRKIRDNELKRVPYLLIVGEKEEAEGLVSVRAQGEGDKGQMTMEAFRDLITGLVKEEIDANKLEKK